MSVQAGNSRAHFLRKLRRVGRNDLADAVEAGEVSAFAVAIELGWRRRPEPLGTGSPNATLRRLFRLRRVGLIAR
jgi:hypothetical protein